jgi:hypothetical protein
MGETDIVHDYRIFGYRFGNTAYITDAESAPQKRYKIFTGIKILIVKHHNWHVIGMHI